MSFRVLNWLLVVLLAYWPLVRCGDLANISPFMYPAPDNREYFTPSPISSNDWTHELDGRFQTHVAHNLFFFRDPATKKIRNCLRTIGGKVSTIGSKSLLLEKDSEGRQIFTRTEFMRFADQYVCFNGAAYFTGDVNSTIPVNLFINNLKRMTTDTLLHSGAISDGVLDAPSIDAKTVYSHTNRWTIPQNYTELPVVRTLTSTNLNCIDGSMGNARSGVCVETLSEQTTTSGINQCRTLVHRDTDASITAINAFTNAATLSDARYTIGADCLLENPLPFNGNSELPDCNLGLPSLECVYRAGAYAHMPLICGIDTAGYNIRCTDVNKWDQLVNPGEPRNVFRTRISAFDVINTIPRTAMTAPNTISYSSWEQTSLAYFFDGVQRFPPSLALLAGAPPISLPVTQTAHIFSLPWAHRGPLAPVTRPLLPVKTRLANSPSWIEYAQNNIYRLGVPEEQAFFMPCPIALRNNTGVSVGTPCNIIRGRNINACDDTTRRCFCDENWLGIACDIPYPTIGGRRMFYEELVADPTDPYEICSTAGALIDTGTFTFLSPRAYSSEHTFTNVPICRCINGFEGLPTDFQSYMPIYAQMFADDMVAAYASTSDSTLFADDVIFTSLATAADDAAYNLIWATDPMPPGVDTSRKIRLKYDWYYHVMTHQCMIWTRTLSKPPQNVWWDYHSYPWVAASIQDGLGEYSYTHRDDLWYPWPAISTTRRNATDLNPAADGRQGVRCMDYEEFNWDAIVAAGPPTDLVDQGAFFVAKFVQWLQANDTFWPLPAPGTANIGSALDANGDPTTFKAKLYGGSLCLPCPDCNRAHSVCVDGPPYSYQCACDPGTETCQTSTDSVLCAIFNPARPTSCPVECFIEDVSISIPPYSVPVCKKHVTTYYKICTDKLTAPVCQCDRNFCGPTCDAQLCPVTPWNTVCGNGTCTVDPDNKCENLGPGQYAGTCVCNPGFNGTDCSNVACPYFSSIDGSMCGNGTCVAEAGRCLCNAGWTGDACDLPACPFDPNNNRECSGLTRADNGLTVCNRATQQCECTRAINYNFGGSTPGWPQTDLNAYVEGRYGLACEKPFGSVCRNPRDGSWCGQPIFANGDFNGTQVDAYAGCYNDTCARTNLGGQECTPYCHCTLEYALPNNTYCQRSVCGPDRCGYPKGKCKVGCAKGTTPKDEHSCPTTAVLAGDLTLTGKCICQYFNNTFYWHRHNDVGDLEPCVDPAPLCYTPATSPLPCNGQGSCAYNDTSGVHFCMCNTGYTGLNCSTAPSCFTPTTTAQACVGSTRYCQHMGANRNPYCTCLPNYLRDADRNCTRERCVTTGGTAESDGTCACPEGRQIWSDVPLWRIDLTQAKLGCRKGCPLADHGVPCGATDYLRPATNNGSRCSDLYPIVDPIFGDDPRPAPTCVCNFLGLDRMGNLNYFINATDDSGLCVPKCNPEGLCNAANGECPGGGASVDTTAPFACHCAAGYSGENCTDFNCNTEHSHHTGGGNCQCETWCATGPDCHTDVCAPSGGKCTRGLPDCDCSFHSNVLKIDSSSGLIFHRNCTSACENGGVLSADKGSCICPSPYHGTLCKDTQDCNVQWSGTFCNISNCRNGAAPLPIGQDGCTCTDAFYQGALCDQDVCTVANRRNRSASGVCGCWGLLSGANCNTDPCQPGGTLSLITNTCVCLARWTLAANQSSCLPPTTDLDCGDHGTLFNNSVSGVQLCICDAGYTGFNCSTPQCPLDTDPSLPDPLQYGPYCTCPPGSYGPDCSETYCDSTSDGYNATSYQCICPTGYRLADTPDASGTFQCVPNPHYCYYAGTLDWSNDSNPVPCVCETGWSGPTCSVFSGTDSGSSDPLLTTHQMVALAIAALAIVLIAVGGYYLVKWIRGTPELPPTVVSTRVRHSRHRTRKHLFRLVPDSAE